MIPDTNNAIDLAYNGFVGITGGDILTFAILILIVIGYALIVSRSKSSVVMVVGFCLIFVFSLVYAQLIVMFWVILIVAIFVLINGLRKWLTGQ